MARGDQANRRSIPARVRDFLRDRPGRVYCDTCIQERLGLKWRQQAQLITATLAVTSEFDRGRWVCSTCNQTKFGILARRSPHDAAVPVEGKNEDDPEPGPAEDRDESGRHDRVVIKLNRSR
jgi:hypothetical protein